MLLTIAIPTYNREKYLDECLKHIQPMLNDEVEVLVSDNASQDHTESMIQNRYGFVKYYRNQVNLGPDRNILNCMENASGKYVWVFADDDIILPDAVGVILDFLKKNEPDFVHLNSCDFANDFIDETHCTKPRFLGGKDLITSDKEEFLKKVGIHITFLTSLIFRKELLDAQENLERFIGSYFLQANAAFLTMAGKKKLGVVGF